MNSSVQPSIFLPIVLFVTRELQVTAQFTERPRQSFGEFPCIIYKPGQLCTYALHLTL